jgi:Galactosyltransferase
MTQSSRTLLAIINARHRKEWRDAIRSTWLLQVPREKADAFFFVGRGEPLGDPQGVVELSCSDKYEHLPEKIITLCNWAHSKGYSHLLKCDDDCVLRPQDFLSSGYEKYEYSGCSNRPESPYAVPYGFGYVLDRKCMEIIGASKPPGDGSLDDEKHCAFTLSEHGIRLHDDRRYFLHQLRLPTEEKAKRPLRAPKRPVVESIWGNQPYPGTFSYCVHIAAELSEKIEEYHKLWLRHREC